MRNAAQWMRWHCWKIIQMVGSGEIFRYHGDFMAHDDDWLINRFRFSRAVLLGLCDGLVSRQNAPEPHHPGADICADHSGVSGNQPLPAGSSRQFDVFDMINNIWCYFFCLKSLLGTILRQCAIIHIRIILRQCVPVRPGRTDSQEFSHGARTPCDVAQGCPCPTCSRHALMVPYHSPLGLHLQIRPLLFHLCYRSLCATQTISSGDDVQPLVFTLLVTPLLWPPKNIIFLTSTHKLLYFGLHEIPFPCLFCQYWA